MKDYEKLVGDANYILRNIVNSCDNMSDVILSFVSNKEYTTFHCYYSLYLDNGCQHSDSVYMKEDTIAYSYLTKEVDKDVLVRWALSNCRGIVKDVPTHTITTPDIDTSCWDDGTADTCNLVFDDVIHTGNTYVTVDKLHVDDDIYSAMRQVRRMWGSGVIGGANISGKA